MPCRIRDACCRLSVSPVCMYCHARSVMLQSVFAKAGKAKAQEGEDDEDDDEEAAADPEGAEVDRRRLALYERSKLRYGGCAVRPCHQWQP